MVRHLVLLNPLDSQPSFLLVENPPHRPRGRLGCIKEEEEGDQRRAQTGRPLDNKQPSPASEASVALEFRVHTGGDQPRKRRRHDRARVHHRDAQPQLLLRVPARHEPQRAGGEGRLEQAEQEPRARHLGVGLAGGHGGRDDGPQRGKGRQIQGGPDARNQHIARDHHRDVPDSGHCHNGVVLRAVHAEVIFKGAELCLSVYKGQ